jgi:hypothetical protein
MTWPDSHRFKAIDIRRNPWRGIPEEGFHSLP